STESHRSNTLHGSGGGGGYPGTPGRAGRLPAAHVGFTRRVEHLRPTAPVECPAGAVCLLCATAGRQAWSRTPGQEAKPWHAIAAPVNPVSTMTRWSTSNGLCHLPIRASTAAYGASLSS